MNTVCDINWAPVLVPLIPPPEWYCLPSRQRSRSRGNEGTPSRNETSWLDGGNLALPPPSVFFLMSVGERIEGDRMTSSPHTRASLNLGPPGGLPFTEDLGDPPPYHHQREKDVGGCISFLQRRLLLPSPTKRSRARGTLEDDVYALPWNWALLSSVLLCVPLLFLGKVSGRYPPPPAPPPPQTVEAF